MLIDLNSDMGESFGPWAMGDDARMLEIVSSANIACGFHAGDPEVVHSMLSLAHAQGVGAGAHPGFYDLQGFGRRQILGDSPGQIERQIIYQIGALQGLAKSIGIPLRHVKTHGALGNLAAEEPAQAQAVARAIYSVDRDLIMVVMPGMETEKAALKLGLPVVREIYADRAYADNGNLLSLPFTPASLNLFMNVPVAANGALDRVPPRSLAGDTLQLRAECDIWLVLSACQQDITPINGASRQPSDIGLRWVGDAAGLEVTA